MIFAIAWMGTAGKRVIPISNAPKHYLSVTYETECVKIPAQLIPIVPMNFLSVT